MSDLSETLLRLVPTLETCLRLECELSAARIAAAAVVADVYRSYDGQ